MRDVGARVRVDAPIRVAEEVRNEQERQTHYIPSKGGRKVRYESGEVGREKREVCRESWEVGSENRDVGSERWEARSKNREVGSERRGISKESPLFFLIQKGYTRKILTFSSRTTRLSERKTLSLRLIKHNFPFPVAKRHRYSAISMNYFPMIQHKCSLTY